MSKRRTDRQIVDSIFEALTLENKMASQQMEIGERYPKDNLTSFAELMKLTKLDRSTLEKWLKLIYHIQGEWDLNKVSVDEGRSVYKLTHPTTRRKI